LAYYYVDTISSASVDVMSNATPYTKDRKEGMLGVEHLLDKTVMAFSVRTSKEDDYLAQSVNFNISQDTFGDMTNLSMGLAFGANEISRNRDDVFAEESQQFRIRAGINQIITRNLTLGLNVEAVTDEGYFNNSYRTVRYADDSAAGYGSQAEVYPNTRNYFAAKLSASYYLPYRAALLFSYRHFVDSWEISANDAELAYRHPIADSFEIGLKARYYQQTQASFYSDIFEYEDAQNFLARDKELSDFNDLTLGFGLTYFILPKYMMGGHSEALFLWDYIDFSYNNFRNATVKTVPVVEEPLYGFTANVIRVFFNLYF